MNFAMRLPRLARPLLAAFCAGIAPLAGAIEPVPETVGWRGFVVLGVGYAHIESNLVAGNDLLDIGRPDIGSVDQSPGGDDSVHSVVTGEINYTFANGWQAFLGTSLEDAVTLDAVSQVGVRKDIGDAGIVQGSVTFSGIPTDVWEDPYAEGTPREETERSATGARLRWDRVMGSAFELTLNYRDISIDTERSGQGLISRSCDVTCQGLLRRDGSRYSLDASYLYRFGANRNHLLRPMFRYTLDDLEGDAVRGDSYRLQLSYIHVRESVTLVSNLVAGTTLRDERNPIFGTRTNVDRFAVDTTVFYRIPSTSGRWQAVGSVQWGEENADVRFHDSKLFMVSIGALYRFGAR